MEIGDFEIKIKKYDDKNSVVYLNLIIFGVLEIRGYTVRYTTTRYSADHAVWIANPPSIKSRNRKSFWIVRVIDADLWKQLQCEIIAKAKEYTGSL